MQEHGKECRSPAICQDFNRRRLLAALGGAAALFAGVPIQASAVQSSTPPAEAAKRDALATLSQNLCGGGTFAADQTTALLTLLESDADLAKGLDELLAAATSVATPTAARSDAAKATAQAILLYWYTGSFKGQPITNRAAVYTQLTAWQAMYTPAWTTCKLYGAWADEPTLTPQVPQNA